MEQNKIIEDLKIKDSWLFEEAREETQEKIQENLKEEAKKQEAQKESKQMSKDYRASVVQKKYGFSQIDGLSEEEKERMRIGSYENSLTVLTEEEEVKQVKEEKNIEALRDKFLKEKDELATSKRTFFSDSAEMKEVKRCLSNLTLGLSEPVPMEEQEFGRQMSLRIQEYAEAEIACFAYVNGKKKKNKRYNLVSTMYNYVKEERKQLLSKINLGRELTREGDCWLDFIKVARCTVIAGKEDLKGRELKELDDNEKSAIAARRLGEILGTAGLYEKHHLCINESKSTGNEGKTVTKKEYKAVVTKAEGETLKSLKEKIRDKKNKKLTEEQKRQEKVKRGLFADKKYEEAAPFIRYTTEALTQLSAIKLLDQIMGINNRSEDEIIVSTRDLPGESILITSVQAKATKDAFKKLTVGDEKISLESFGYDEAMINKLTSMTPDMVDFLFGDILGERERAIVKQRLRALRYAIANNGAFIGSKREVNRNLLQRSSGDLRRKVYKYKEQTTSKEIESFSEKEEPISKQLESGGLDSNVAKYSKNTEKSEHDKADQAIKNGSELLLKNSNLAKSSEDNWNLRRYRDIVYENINEFYVKDKEGKDVMLKGQAFKDKVNELRKRDIKQVMHHQKFEIGFKELPKDAPLFSKMPSVEDVKQGGLGDCYFIASIAKLVSENPMHIVNMMKDMGDGYVRVRLYNGSSPKIVTVKKATAVKSGDNGDEDIFAKDALWVQILEMALAISGLHIGNSGEEAIDMVNRALNKKNKMSDSEKKLLSKNANTTYISIDGGTTKDAYKYLTGKSSVETPIRYMGLANSTFDSGCEDKVSDVFYNSSDTFSESLMDSIYEGLIGELRKKTVFKSTDNKDFSVKNITVNMVAEAIMSMENWAVTENFAGFEEVLRSYKKQKGNIKKTVKDFKTELTKMVDNMFIQCRNGIGKLDFDYNTKIGDSYVYSMEALTAFKNIKGAIDDKKFVTFSSRKYKPKNGGTNRSGGRESENDGMFETHAYTVLDYKEENGRKTVIVRNPHGHNGLKHVKYTDDLGNEVDSGDISMFDGRDSSGIFELDLNEMMRFIRSYTISSKSEV